MTTRNLQFKKDSSGRLNLLATDGSEIAGVVPLRLFPLSEPTDWIAILDSSGREVCVIEKVESLEPVSRDLLAGELARREFVPELRRILWVSGNSEPCSWQVETDRGQTEFVLKSEDDIRRLGSRSVLVVDSHGVRYMIPDRHQLDAYSRRVVEWYV